VGVREKLEIGSRVDARYWRESELVRRGRCRESVGGQRGENAIRPFGNLRRRDGVAAVEKPSAGVMSAMRV
jgi:hypothetical protein